MTSPSDAEISPIPDPPPSVASPSGLRAYLQAMAWVGGLVVGAVGVTWVLTHHAAPDMARVSAASDALLQNLDSASVELAKRVLPCVVSIDTTSNRYADNYVIGPDMRARFYDREVESEYGIGSGVIVSAEGHIVTNYHVVKTLDLKNGTDRLDVWLHEGRQPEPVELLGWDEAADIAVLKLKNSAGRSFPFLSWGDSGEMSMGSLVFAFGSPFGLSETMTSGRISNNHRQISGTGDAMRFFQTDCVINPGNSGGPLVNHRGEMIGINWAIYSNQENDKSWQGVGLVLPGNHVRQVVESLVKNKSPSPYVGVDFGEKTRDGKRQVLITTVDRASPASKAGLKVGDVVHQVNGVIPESAVSAWKMVRDGGSAGTVGFTVGRSGVEGEREVAVKLTK